MTRRRSAQAILLLVALPLVPGLVIHIASLTSATGITSLAVISGLLASALAGPRIGVTTALLLSVAAGTSTIAADVPWLAGALMAAAAAVYGLGAGRGILGATVMAPIAVGFMVAEPTSLVDGTWANAALVGLVALATSLWGVACGALAHRQLPPLHAKGTSDKVARTFAVGLAVVVGASAWLATALQWGHGGAWFVMTLFVVIQPSTRETWSKALARSLGTVLGFIVAIVIGLVITAPVVLYVLGAAFFILAFWMRYLRHRPYWQYALLLTPAIVLLEGAGSSVTRTAESRLAFTLLGAVVALTVTAMVAGVPRLRHDQ